MAFHLHRNGQSTVFELATLREMAKRGELPQDEYVYVDEKSEWIGAGQVPELQGAWNIEESESTVAVMVSEDFLAEFDRREREAAEAKAAAKLLGARARAAADTGRAGRHPVAQAARRPTARARAGHARSGRRPAR